MERSKNGRATVRKDGRSSQAEYQRARRLERDFGMTVEQYDEMLEAQGGVCPGCGSSTYAPDDDRRLAVDHCHKTLRNRGLLCMACNRAIGMVGDDPARLVALAAYLIAHEENANV